MSTSPLDGAVGLAEAYEAAVIRATKTTEALILAEARILDQSKQLLQLGEENTRLNLELEARYREEEGDGESDPDGYTAAIGQAD